MSLWLIFKTIMSGFFDSTSDIVFDSGSTPLQWATRVFSDPLTLAHRIPADLASADYITPESEEAFYLDWQTRDTEIGFRLLDRRREELLRGVEVYRSALTRKRKTITLTRTRLDALQKLNAAEKDPARKQPQQIFSQLDAEVRAAQAELNALRRYVAPVEALHTMLQPVVGGASNDDHHLAEQRMRLLGQAWRGWMRVYAFRRAYPAAASATLTVEAGPLFEGLVVAQDDEAPAPFATDIVIERDTLCYLRHFLDAIVALSRECAPYFSAPARPAPEGESWPVLMQLLRAITEFFYVCGFELPLISNNLIIDLDDPEKLWIYYHERQEWQPAPAESISNRLRRDASLVAHLIAANPPLLGWRNIDDVRVAAVESNNLQPYRSTGLARLDLNPGARTPKFQSAYRLTGRLLERLTAFDSALSGSLQSALGGPLETLTAMARLDHQAFKLPGDAAAMPDAERMQWLARFWKTMGKRRPVALLGDRYAKDVTAGLNELGEPSPDRSSLLSIQLSTFLSRTAIGADKSAAQDLLAGLLMADQIRLVELVNASLTFVGEIATGVSVAKQPAQLDSFVTSWPVMASRHEEEISRRFNVKWLSTQQPLWRVLSAAVPAVWEFWSALAKNEGWSASLANVGIEEGLVSLLTLSAELTRLAVMVESASPFAAERLNLEPESTGRAVLAAFQPHQRITAVSDLLRFYYDPDVPHDAWIAFTGSFKQYLQQLHNDLKQLDSEAAHVTLLGGVIKQLELHYPTLPARRIARRSGKLMTLTQDAMALPVKPAALDDKDAAAVDAICSDLLGKEGLDRLAFLKLLAILREPELRTAFHQIASARKALHACCGETKLRRAIVSMPGALRDTATMIADLPVDGDGAPVIDADKGGQLTAYLTQLDAFQRYAETALGGSALYQAEDREDVRHLAMGERTSLLLFAVFNRPFCILVRERAALAVDSFEDYLKQQVVGQLSDWQPEYLLLCAVGLRRHESGLIVTGSDIGCDPIFLEPERAASERTLVTLVRGKFHLAAAVLKHELPDMRVSVQPN